MPEKHRCLPQLEDLAIDKEVLEKIPMYPCNSSGCRIRDPIEMPCVVCRLHFCLSHRHHGCLDKTPSQEKRDKYRAPREQFRLAKAETDRKVQERLKTAKNRALANKIKLMKIKSTAVGDNHVPTMDRVYFSVAPPILTNTISQHRNFFVSKHWTLGKSIEMFAKKFRVRDGYDNLEEPKLRIFDLEGMPVPGLTGDTISELIQIGVIMDGDSLILEYVPAIEKDNDLYDRLTDKTLLDRYKFA